MKAMSFLLDDPALTRAWAKLTRFPIFDTLRGKRTRAQRRPRPSGASVTGFFAHLDRWFSRQAQRDLEAYLAGARDIYELEERIRRLERSGASRFYG